MRFALFFVLITVIFTAANFFWDKTAILVSEVSGIPSRYVYLLSTVIFS